MQLPLFHDPEQPDPWAVRPGEPHKIYARFEGYRLLGPERSIRRAWAKLTKRTTGNPSDKWYAAAKRWEWKERAEAWDAQERERTRREYEQDRTDDRAERINIAKHARLRLVEALAALDPATAKWGEVMGGLKLIFGELRADYGDDPKYRQDLKPNDASAAPLHITLKGVSPDDL